MKTTTSKAALSVMALLLLPPLAHPQSHGHLNGGALGTKQNDKLFFDNASEFATNSAYVKTLALTNSGTYAGYYQGNITLTSLAATTPFGGPVPNAPALGSFVHAQLAFVDGPAGGSFGFWEAGSTSPTISLLSGQTGTNVWRLTESDGSAGTDPYGHIHGRRFTATKPGLYAVGFRLVDTSTNGENGGPIHAPSDTLTVYFQAGVSIVSLVRTGSVTTITYGSAIGQSFIVEYSTNLSDPAGWRQISVPTAGTDLLQSQRDPNSTDSSRFYRIRTTSP